MNRTAASLVAITAAGLLSVGTTDAFAQRGSGRAGASGGAHFAVGGGGYRGGAIVARPGYGGVVGRTGYNGRWGHYGYQRPYYGYGGYYDNGFYGPGLLAAPLLALAALPFLGMAALAGPAYVDDSVYYDGYGHYPVAYSYGYPPRGYISAGYYQPRAYVRYYNRPYARAVHHQSAHRVATTRNVIVARSHQ